MPSATDALVRGIIDVDSSIADTSPFIAAAASVVAAQCSGLSAENVTLVETWLAAHYLAIRDLRRSSQEVSEAKESYMHKVDLGLNLTMYGQTAMTLDSTGGLARWNDKLQKGSAGQGPRAFWIGTAAE